MSARTMTAAGIDADGAGLYRVGGLAAIAFGIAYLAIFPLYASVGAPPSGGEAWLAYAAGKTTAWWAILGLSVLTDFLLVPVALSLYHALRGFGRNAMLVATAFVGAFIVLDLAVTWPNYAARIALAEDVAGATTEAQRAAIAGASTYASAVLSSTLTGVYSIVTLSVGIGITGLVMRRGVFPRSAAYLGVATGILGVAAVAGPFLVGALGATIVLASVLTTAWALVSGYRLYRLGRD